VNLRSAEHPWNDLAFEGGTLVSVTRRTAYLVCPPIIIKGVSQNFSPKANGQVACTYPLNTAPDQTWQRLLHSFLDVPRAGVLGKFMVEIESQKLVLAARPSDFRLRFEILQAAIIQANEAYAKEWEWVVQHLKYLSEKRSVSKRRGAA
jgi:hypothetical protein